MKNAWIEWRKRHYGWHKKQGHDVDNNPMEDWGSGLLLPPVLPTQICYTCNLKWVQGC